MKAKGMFQVVRRKEREYEHCEILVYSKLDQHAYSFSIFRVDLSWQRNTDGELGGRWYACNLEARANKAEHFKFAAKIAQIIDLDSQPDPQVAVAKLKESGYAQVSYHRDANIYIPVDSWPTDREYFYAELDGRYLYTTFATDLEEARKLLVKQAGESIARNPYGSAKAERWLASGKVIRSCGSPIPLNIPSLETEPAEVA